MEIKKMKTRIAIISLLTPIFIISFYIFFVQVFTPNSQVASTIGYLASQNSSLYDDNEPGKYTVKFSAGTGGQLNGQVSQEVEEGKNSSRVTAIADPGYVFFDWTGDVTSTSDSLTIKNVKSNQSATANFKKVYKYLFVLVAGAFSSVCRSASCPFF
jgi:uncharacterized repeat protein (TIGR02543 family)